MWVNFINKYQNLVISKSGKSNFKIIKFEVENFEVIKKQKNYPQQSCYLHKIGANIYSKLAVLCKKVWSWVDGWMD